MNAAPGDIGVDPRLRGHGGAGLVGGRVWKLGDNVDTDVLAPGAFMKFGIDEIAKHCLEALRPEFAADVRPGDVIVAGRNFGVGSSREQAPEALRHLGVAAVVAESFSGLFYRNALNLGLPVVVSADCNQIDEGVRLLVDLERGEMTTTPGASSFRCEAIPQFLMEMVRAGGLLAYLEHRRRASP